MSLDKIAAIVGRELAQTLLRLGGGTNRIKGKGSSSTTLETRALSVQQIVELSRVAPHM